MTERSDAVFKMTDLDSDRWGDLIEWLCDPDGTYSFLSTSQREDPFYLALLALDEDDLRDARLNAEICPVHHVDAAICLDDAVGDGMERCGERVPRDVPVADLKPGDVLDMGVFASFVPDPDPAGRAGWIVFADGTRCSTSAGYPVRVWVAR